MALKRLLPSATPRLCARKNSPMALHPNFPESPYAILDPEIRWFPADETRRKLAVKVVDIFGNDTMTIVEVMVGEKK